MIHVRKNCKYPSMKLSHTTWGGFLGSSLQRENSSDETKIYGRNNGNSKDEIIFSELEAIEEELNTPQVTSD